MLAALAALITASAAVEPVRYDDAGSYSDGVALTSMGDFTVLPAGSGAQLLPGSRVLATTIADDAGLGTAADLATAQQRWLADGWLPEDPRYRDLVANALLDMRVLSTGGAPVASGNHNWRYVWPRDSSFVAVAFAASGHGEDAVTVLTFLQQVQAPDGSFEARYLPDGSGPPDARPAQTDGTGWALWALDAVIAAAPASQARELLRRFEPLRTRSTEYLLAQVDNPRSLPAPSPDYWEHRENVVTLGTAAPVLAGLEASARLAGRADDHATQALATDATERLRASITLNFGEHGYGRYPGPSRPDAASAFLLPPFQSTALHGAEQAWAASVPTMMRPAGGLAPGALWREQNLSWTPQTALYALAAASVGEAEQARDWLDWLTAHRTPLGALPEKVNAAGEPSGPAPLAWTCALVVLTVVELE